MSIFKNLFGKSKNRRKCFPHIDDVFHYPSDLDLVFYPLVTININEVIPGRNKWIHFVDVWNNGDIEDDMFGEYRNRDFIKFKLENSKYHYFGNKTAFPNYSNLENWKKESMEEYAAHSNEYIKIPTREEYENSERHRKELDRENIAFDYYLYVDQQISYLVNQERYQQKGQLITHKSYPKGYSYKIHEPLKQIGGVPQWEQRDLTPFNKNGVSLTFIGHVKGYNYLENGSDNIYLFLDEASNEVIQIFQYG